MNHIPYYVGCFASRVLDTSDNLVGCAFISKTIVSGDLSQAFFELAD